MRFLVLIIFLFPGFLFFGQEVDGEASKLSRIIQALEQFTKNIPHEKVYLHFDNTSYYQDDNIWFKCYITSPQLQANDLSKTLYVELLNPGGEVVGKRILKIENGQCHGDFTLNHTPFYSGYYEVRAYTKYMLNFGEDVIFSRLIPVFNKPKIEGHFEEKNMLRYSRWGISNFPIIRETPESGKKVNLRFFPEGGNLIQGIASRVAFEATDETGNPIDVTGIVMDAAKQVLCTITTLHEGRGVFYYTPGAPGRRKDMAEVEYKGQKYQFDLPAGLPQGVEMEVDNLSFSDSIAITLRKNVSTPSTMLGVAVLNGGNLQNAYSVYIEDDEFVFKIDKTKWPSGVSQIALFNSEGDILCDRLIFTNLSKLLNYELLNVKVKTDKPVYSPYEPVDMEISVTDSDSIPVSTSLSLSVRDGDNEIEYKQNILTDLLLMSEIKGYVRNPSYYFEKENDTISLHLDLLLMVQGWRRYAWDRMAGLEPFELKYLPEQGIETHGNVVSFVKKTPMPNVDVSMMLSKKTDEQDMGGSLINTFVTDSLGHFAFIVDASGKWNMILSVMEKGKKKDHLIVLDRDFSPTPKRYRYFDMQARISEKNYDIPNGDEMTEQTVDDSDNFLIAYRDSIAKINENVRFLDEVTVTAKRSSKEQDIRRNRSTSVAYYDVPSQYDHFYDKGMYIGDDIHELLKNTNKFFTLRASNIVGERNNYEYLYYKYNKLALVVVNYRKVMYCEDEFEYLQYLGVALPAIKSIYINEHPSVMVQYVSNCDPLVSPMETVDKYFNCIVFIETYPEGQIPVKGNKGVRKTWLEGYSAAMEFYSPNYSTLQPQQDFRRTLYWNPSVITDDTGKAKISFYNNSSCTNFSISAEAISLKGMTGFLPYYR